MKCKTKCEFVIKNIFVLEMSTLVKYQQVAIQKGGLLLSTSVSRSKLQWQCRDGHIFWLTFYKVNRSGKWCPTCGASIGERDIRAVLQEFNIPFLQQAILPILPRRKYDFYFEYDNRKFLVEFDGEQHFRYVRKYHKTKGKFFEAQIVDRVKTWASLNSQCHMIRIDYTQRDNTKYHITMAVNMRCNLYLSDPILYKYISDINVTSEQLRQYIRI